MAMIELNTVLPSLISILTDNPVAFGGIYSIMLGAPLIFNLLFSKYLAKFAYKKKFLLMGIYVRGLSFLAMAALTLYFALSHPGRVLIGFYFLVFLFSVSGGLAGIAYADMVGKLLPSKERGQLYAMKQMAAGIAALLAGFFVAWVFKPGNLAFPYNYSLNLFIGFLGLVIGAIGFILIKEPPSAVKIKTQEDEGSILKDVYKVLKKDQALRKFIIIENLTGFNLMILPFYLIFIKENFADFEKYLGIYVIAQILGNIGSNLLWARLSKYSGSVKVVKTCILIGSFIPLIALAIRPFGPLTYVVIFILIGFVTSGRSVGFEPYLLDISPEEDRTLYLGIRGSMNIFVVFLPLAGGAFIGLMGYELTFILVAFIMFSTFVIINRQKSRS